MFPGDCDSLLTVCDNAKATIKQIPQMHTQWTRLICNNVSYTNSAQSGSSNPAKNNPNYPSDPSIVVKLVNLNTTGIMEVCPKAD